MATIDDVLAHQDDTAFAIALSDLVFPRADEEGVESLTPGECVADCVDALEREVNNGGFDVFSDPLASLLRASVEKHRSDFRPR